MSEHDFMPIDGWDHIEIWVGNAKQSAYFYEHAYGFTRTAYAGPETGVRDRASYVLEQGEIRFVLTSGLRADSDICRWAATKGDSVRDVALAVPDATNAYRQAVQRGARGVVEPHWVEDDQGRVELAAIATYGDNIHTFVNRSEYSGAYLPGYQSSRSTTLSATSSSAAWTSGSTSTRAFSASRSSRTSRTRTSRPSTPR
jgi:4-hydroxyphenylpyruvate dioxygenase